MKRCNRCNTEKPYEQFGKNSSKLDGLQTQCKLCRKETNSASYHRTKGSQNPKRQASKALFVKRNRDYVKALLQKSSCIDCNNSDWRVLEFDHVTKDKTKDISGMIVGNSLEKIKKEIEKCEIRCANCHRIKTAERAGYWRSQ